MRSAKVIVTDVGGKGKKIFHYGDVVTENSFPVGNFDRLIAGGFLKESEGNVEVPVEIEITETVNDETVVIVTAPKEEPSAEPEPDNNNEEGSNEENSEETSEEKRKGKKNKFKK